jgi:hypothetical protein
MNHKQADENIAHRNRVTIAKGMITPVKNQKQLLWLNVSICIFAILKSGLRNLSTLEVGNDTPSYLDAYQQVSSMSWSMLLKNFSFFSQDYDARDLGYPIFIKVTQIFINDFRFYMILVAAIFLIPLSRLIYQYVHTYLAMILAWMIYFSLFTVITDSFMRQAIALGLLIYAYDFIYKRDWKKYYILNLLAFFIHGSAILAVPLYFLPYTKNLRVLFFIFLASIPFLLTYAEQIAKFFVVGTIYEVYATSSNTTQPVVFTIMIVLVAIMTFIFYKQIKTTPNGSFLIVGIALATVITPMAWVAATMLRTTYYFSIFIIPLIPIIIETIKVSSNTRRVIYFITISILLFLMIR